MFDSLRNSKDTKVWQWNPDRAAEERYTKALRHMDAFLHLLSLFVDFVGTFYGHSSTKQIPTSYFTGFQMDDI